VTPRGLFLSAGHFRRRPRPGPRLILWRQESRRGVRDAYVAKDFGALIGMDGFSEALLKNHFAIPGIRDEYDKLSDLIGRILAEGKTAPGVCRAEAPLRVGVNGMRLHEFYFEKPGRQGRLDPASKLGKAVAAEFAAWRVGGGFPGRRRDARDRLGRLYQDRLGGRSSTSGSTSRHGEPAGRFRSLSWTCSSTPSWSITG